MLLVRTLSNISLPELIGQIRACRLCAATLPLGPHPVIRVADPAARILIIGQAPGRKVHDTGIPWNDASGDRLRQWLGVDRETFYDESRFAIMPMGFCYPGTGPNGDLPPRPECAPAWHDRVLAHLPNIELTLLIGQYAQARYLGVQRQASLGATVRAWRGYLDRGLLPLVHPSPRNHGWLAAHPWFEAEVVPALRAMVAGISGAPPQHRERVSGC